MIDKTTQQIICTACGKGGCHDFKLFQRSHTRVHPNTTVLADSGYQGLQKRHSRSELPIKRSKQQPLSPEAKAINHTLASKRVVVEHTISRLKRFSLRFNLLAALCNFELLTSTHPT